MSKTPKHRAAVPEPVSATYSPETTAAIRKVAGDEAAVEAAARGGGGRPSPKPGGKAAAPKKAKEA